MKSNISVLTNRRAFIAQAGILSAGLMVIPNILKAKPIGHHGVGLQLRTLGDLLPNHLSEVLSKVAQAGFKDVEPFDYSKKDGFWGKDAKAFNELLNANGLKARSGHFEFDNFFKTGNTDDLYAAIDAANIIGMEYLVVPHMHESLKTVADFKAIVYQTKHSRGNLKKRRHDTWLP